MSDLYRITFFILAVNVSLTVPERSLIKSELVKYGSILGIKAKVQIKNIKDRYCQRYDAYGIYNNSPLQSYYFKSCLKRYTSDDNKTINHSLINPFYINSTPAGGGYDSGKCFHLSSRGNTSVSSWLPGLSLESIIALVHELIHALGGGHIPGSITDEAAASRRFTSVSDITKSEVLDCLRDGK